MYLLIHVGIPKSVITNLVHVQFQMSKVTLAAKANMPQSPRGGNFNILWGDLAVGVCL